MIFHFEETATKLPYNLQVQYHPNLDYITLREVDEGGDPMEDWVDYDPRCGASDDEETFNCDEILQTMRSIYNHNVRTNF